MPQKPEPCSDSDARRARADQLRKTIREIKGQESAPGAKPETPAAFVHRRMAELEKAKRKPPARRKPKR
jgi:hypothetical protein